MCGSCIVITIWVAYLMAAAVASGIFLMAGWRSKQAHGYIAARAVHGLPYDPLWDESEKDPVESTLHADAAAALRIALKRVAPVMATRFVQADVAAGFGLRVRMGGAALADLLEDMLGALIHAAPASRILLTVAEHGGHVDIAMTDDIPNADVDVRRAGVRGLMERVALRGGFLEVTARPDEGTTMTLRLGAAPEAQEGWALHESAKGPSVPFIPAISFGMSR
jgi:hypothetical protein